MSAATPRDFLGRLDATHFNGAYFRAEMDKPRMIREMLADLAIEEIQLTPGDLHNLLGLARFVRAEGFLPEQMDQLIDDDQREKC